MRHTTAIRRESRKVAPLALRLPNNRFGQQILREGRNGEEREKGWSEHGGLNTLERHSFLFPPSILMSIPSCATTTAS
jgi:hypothetical protein